MLESNKLKVIKKYGFDCFFGIKLPLQLSYLMVFISRKEAGLRSSYQVARFDEVLNSK